VRDVVTHEVVEARPRAGCIPNGPHGLRSDKCGSDVGINRVDWVVHPFGSEDGGREGEELNYIAGGVDRDYGIDFLVDFRDEVQCGTLSWC
jgi:hypothetical protein